MEGILEKQDEILGEFEEILEETNNSQNLTDVKKEAENENLNIIPAPNPKYGKIGGAREGAGRPKGCVSKKTLDERIAMDYVRKRVMISLPKLVNSQMNLARGCQYLFKLKKIYIEKEDKWVVPKGTQPKIVKDKEEIAQYLAGEFEEREDCDYYFITTERPDNKALDSLLDRTFGKATQKVEGNLNVTMADLLKELEE